MKFNDKNSSAENCGWLTQKSDAGAGTEILEIKLWLCIINLCICLSRIKMYLEYVFSLSNTLF